MCLVTFKAGSHHNDPAYCLALFHNNFYYIHRLAPLPLRVTMPFTPDNSLELLFPEELVPQHIKDQLPPELHVRQMCLGITLSFMLSLSGLFDAPSFSHFRFAHWLRQTTRAGTSPCSACLRKLLMWAQKRGQLSSKRCAPNPRRTTSLSSSRARPIRS